MKVEEWFALVLKCLGIVIFLYGSGYLLDALLFHLRYFNYPESSPGYYLITGISYCVASLFLVLGTSHIVEFAFPTHEENNTDEKIDR